MQACNTWYRCAEGYVFPAWNVDAQACMHKASWSIMLLYWPFLMLHVINVWAAAFRWCMCLVRSAGIITSAIDKTVVRNDTVDSKIYQKSRKIISVEIHRTVWLRFPSKYRQRIHIFSHSISNIVFKKQILCKVIDLQKKIYYFQAHRLVEFLCWCYVLLMC